MRFNMPSVWHSVMPRSVSCTLSLPFDPTTTKSINIKLSEIRFRWAKDSEKSCLRDNDDTAKGHTTAVSNHKCSDDDILQPRN